MNYKRFLEITRFHWNKYLNLVIKAGKEGYLDTGGGQILFPQILLHTKTKNHYVAELLGADKKFNGLTEKSHNEISINRYFNQFDTSKGKPLFNMNAKGLSTITNITLSRQVDFNDLKSRFPFVSDQGTIFIPPENTTGTLISFGNDFEALCIENCMLVNTNSTCFRVKSILNLIVVSEKMRAVDYNQDFENYLLQDNNVKGIYTCRDEKGEDLALASQFASTYLLYGLRETTIGEFLNKHSTIIKRGLGTKNYEYEPYLKWIESSEDNTDTAINPDLMIERDDGYYDIYDLKTALLNKKKITKGKRSRRRFIDYVEEGVAQLANYAEYFDYAKNREHALQKYGIQVKNPNLILIVGNYDNVNKTEVEEASRRLKNFTIIDYDSFLQLFLLSKSPKP